VKGTAPTSSFSCCTDRQERRSGLSACRRPSRSRGSFRKTACCAKRAYWPVNRPLPSKSRTTNLGPFGEVIRATGPMAKANPFRFSTKYQDDETDLLYYGYRYYNASTGRWLSRDPIEEDGGLNLYGFVWNDPLSEVDSFGLVTCKCTDAPNTPRDRMPAGALGGAATACNIHINYTTRGCCRWGLPPVGTKIDKVDVSCQCTIYYQTGENPDTDKRPSGRTVRQHEMQHVKYNEAFATSVESILNGYKGKCLSSKCFGLLEAYIAAAKSYYADYRELQSVGLDIGDSYPKDPDLPGRRQQQTNLQNKVNQDKQAMTTAQNALKACQ
jgi:RHS repeat-associated protein